ncbi:MAG: hypothetical protein H7Z17_08130 [Fuerstia sp.]|nr:hypothetical protein [Fuerstiella sp.]
MRKRYVTIEQPVAIDLPEFTGSSQFRGITWRPDDRRDARATVAFGMIVKELRCGIHWILNSSGTVGIPAPAT